MKSRKRRWEWGWEGTSNQPGGGLLVARKVEREMRGRVGRIDVKQQGSQGRLPVMRLEVRKGKSV